jgi:hypothetical protein
MTLRAWTASVLDLKDNIAGVSDRVTLTSPNPLGVACLTDDTIHGEMTTTHIHIFKSRVLWQTDEHA